MKPDGRHHCIFAQSQRGPVLVVSAELGVVREGEVVGVP